jgi:hypothetical protein
MPDLLLELKASTYGEPFRLVATGVKPIGGNAQFSTTGPLPQELLRALSHYFEEFERRNLELHDRASRLRGEFYRGVMH